MRVSVRPLSSVALVLCALAALAAGKAAPPLEGSWDGPGGRIQLKRKGDKVTGVLAAPADGSKLAAGAAVLTGTFYEDNLTAEIRLGAVVPACGDEAGKAFAMLLLTKSGRLTGGLSAREDCAKDVSSLTLQRVADADKAPPPMLGPRAPEGAYDPRGQRKRPLAASVRDLMNDAANYLQEGRFEKAREQFERVVKKDPGIGEAYNGVGVTYYARQDYEAAIEWYKRGLEAVPGFGDLYYNLACAYSLLGKKAMALRYLRLAAAKGYGEVENMDKDGDLASLREEPDYARIRWIMQNPGAPLPALEEGTFGVPVPPPPAPPPAETTATPPAP